MFAFIPDQAPSTERGLCAYGCAQLYADQQRDEAAIAMGTLAARQFSLVEAAPATAACHAQAGLLLQERGDLEPAANELMRALRLLVADPELAPALTARLLLALACVEANLGHAAASRQRLRSARWLYVLADVPGESLEWTWREGQAAAAAGRLAAAERRLDHVRRQLLDAGSPAEAARATLDQAQVRIDAGRARTVEQLTAALAAACPGDGEAWAQEIAGLGRASGGAVPGQGYGLGRELRRRLRQAAAPAGQRTGLIVPWRLLTDRLLRGRAEGADPSGDAHVHTEPKP
jgi:tetratricopeptide (TPR) repeat protein